MCVQHLCSTADTAETTDRQKNSLDECKEGSKGGEEEIEQLRSKEGCNRMKRENKSDIDPK